MRLRLFVCRNLGLLVDGGGGGGGILVAERGGRASCVDGIKVEAGRVRGAVSCLQVMGVANLCVSGGAF